MKLLFLLVLILFLVFPVSSNVRDKEPFCEDPATPEIAKDAAVNSTFLLIRSANDPANPDACSVLGRCWLRKNNIVLTDSHVLDRDKDEEVIRHMQNLFIVSDYNSESYSVDVIGNAVDIKRDLVAMKIRTPETICSAPDPSGHVSCYEKRFHAPALELADSVPEQYAKVYSLESTDHGSTRYIAARQIVNVIYGESANNVLGISPLLSTTNISETGPSGSPLVNVTVMVQ